MATIGPAAWAMADEKPAAAVTQHVVDLRRPVVIVQRHGDEPRLKAGQIGEERLDAVGEQEGEPVARLQPGIQPAARQFRSRFVE
jgi:hypothetical protein